MGEPSPIIFAAVSVESGRLGSGFPLFRLLPGNERRERQLLVAGRAAPDLVPVLRARAQFLPVAPLVEEVVGARQEARQRPHGERRGGGAAGWGEERTKVGRDCTRRGNQGTRGWRMRAQRGAAASGVPVGGGGRDNGVWRGRVCRTLPPFLPLNLLLQLRLLALLDHTLHPQQLGDAEQRRELLLGDAHLPPVHVVQDGLHLGHQHILEEDDGVLAVVVNEQLLEVVGGGGKDNLVALQAASVARQGYVAERLKMIL